MRDYFQWRNSQWDPVQIPGPKNCGQNLVALLSLFSPLQCFRCSLSIPQGSIIAKYLIFRVISLNGEEPLRRRGIVDTCVTHYERGCETAIAAYLTFYSPRKGFYRHDTAYTSHFSHSTHDVTACPDTHSIVIPYQPWNTFPE